jgi:uncharacterized protein YoxC
LAANSSTFCAFPGLPEGTPCSSAEEDERALKQFEEARSSHPCAKHCVPPCHNYQLKDVQWVRPSNTGRETSSLELEPAPSRREVWQESVDYSSNKFVGEFGGHIGFFLGVSLLSLFATFLEKVTGIFEMVNGFLEKVNGFLEKVNGFLKKVNGFLEKVNGFLEKVNGFMEKENGFLEKVNGFLENVNGFLEEVNGLLEEVNVLFKKVNGLL